MQDLQHNLQPLRSFFATGATKEYAFRKAALQKLSKAVTAFEEELMQALYTDLKKSREEVWVTELGFLQAEISHTLKHLKAWMKPEKVATNLLNLPSRSYVYKEPLGVVLIIGPWNYPFQLLFAPLVGAIAAGNCAVLKPSEYAPATAAVMKKLLAATFPQEYILYVEGEGAEVVPKLMNSFRFDHVFYTGSIAVGKAVYQMAAKDLVPVTLELGGKSPCVVESDADITVTAKRIAMTKFSNAGQMCVAPDYVLVHSSIKAAFVAAMKKTIHQFFTDDPSASESYGKIINERAFNRLLRYLEEGNILHGGRTNLATQYIEPTLLELQSINAAVMGEEIFGPLLPILSFDTFEEAKSIIERHPNPLGFYIFTKSKEKEERWLREIPFGGGCINNASWHLTNFNLPFGGRGNSGIGAYHGKYSFAVFSHQKAVMKTPTWFDPAIKYPPFNGKLKLFKKIIR
ncbi:aldehyde dehydrogenase [Flavisolibacter sp. BT320]|nr:aldehyde dehydrogenase [Flavisolibacter longurius]